MRACVDEAATVFTVSFSVVKGEGGMNIGHFRTGFRFESSHGGMYHRVYSLDGDVSESIRGGDPLSAAVVLTDL